MPAARPLSQSHHLAALFRRDSQRLQQQPKASPVDRMVVGFNPDRESRLRGLLEGLLPTVGDCTAMENRIGELRQGAGNAMAFRQALFLLGRVHGVDSLARGEMVRRAMAWWRARGAVDGQLATPWAKSMVAVAQGQAGKCNK